MDKWHIEIYKLHHFLTPLLSHAIKGVNGKGIDSFLIRTYFHIYRTAVLWFIFVGIYTLPQSENSVKRKVHIFCMWHLIITTMHHNKHNPCVFQVSQHQSNSSSTETVSVSKYPPSFISYLKMPFITSHPSTSGTCRFTDIILDHVQPSWQDLLLPMLLLLLLLLLPIS